MKKVNLFIVGAQKCGTTAWARYLGSHPDIFITEVKETSYFAPDFLGMQWIKSQEEYEKLFDRGRDAKVIGDPSAAHICSTVAARRIARYNPAAKIVIFLRDQEQFLPSLHHHFLSRFEEDIEDFATAWRVSGQRPPESLKSFTEPRLLDYAVMGDFYGQVKRYLEVFPPEQIRVIRFEDWTTDPRRTYLQLLQFLDVPDDGRTEFPPVNQAKSFRIKWVGRLIIHPPRFARLIVKAIRRLAGRNALGLTEHATKLFATPGYRVRISPEIREEIRAHYAEDNRRLNEEVMKAGCFIA